MTFDFGRYPENNFWVDKNGIDIWWAYHLFYAIGFSHTLEPGQSIIYPVFNPPYSWDMRDNDGILIGVGEYEVIGGFYANGIGPDSKISVPINIIPEPSTLLILSIGILGIWIKKHRNK